MYFSSAEWGRTMRIALATALFLVVQSLSACSGGGAGGVFKPAGPTREELAAALERVHPGHPVATAEVHQCQEGTIDGKAVQVCGFCFVAAGVAYSDNAFQGGSYLEAVRKTGSAVFHRAMSVDQPDVQPASGQRGVWMVSDLQLDDGRKTASLSDEQMSRVGYQRRPGFRTFIAWTISNADNDPLGGNVSADVAAKFGSDAKLRAETAALVDGCANARPQPRAVPASGQQPKQVRNADRI
jgi:hypothetical protein